MVNMTQFMFVINQIPISDMLIVLYHEVIYPVLVAFWRKCLYIRLSSNLGIRSCLWTYATHTMKEGLPVIPVWHSHCLVSVASLAQYARSMTFPLMFMLVRSFVWSAIRAAARLPCCALSLALMPRMAEHSLWAARRLLAHRFLSSRKSGMWGWS